MGECVDGRWRGLCRAGKTMKAQRRKCRQNRSQWLCWHIVWCGENKDDVFRCFIEREEEEWLLMLAIWTVEAPQLFWNDELGAGLRLTWNSESSVCSSLHHPSEVGIPWHLDLLDVIECRVRSTDDNCRVSDIFAVSSGGFHPGDGSKDMLPRPILGMVVLIDGLDNLAIPHPQAFLATEAPLLLAAVECEAWIAAAVLVLEVVKAVDTCPAFFSALRVNPADHIHCQVEIVFTFTV